MGTIATLRSLWERRLSVAIGLAGAVALAIMLSFRVGLGLPPTFESRQYHVGIASAEVLVDSPNSQVVDLGGGAASIDVAALSVRARLLGDLVATRSVKDQIARRAGIAPHQLIALRPSTERPHEPSQLETGATVRPGDPRANILSVRVHEELPIIGLDAQAPEPARAARIADAAVTELGLYLSRAASASDVPSSRKIVIEPLGAARSSISRRGPGPILAGIVAIFAFGLWCAGLLAVAGLVRGLRQPTVESAPDAAPLTPRGRPPAPPTQRSAVPTPANTPWVAADVLSGRPAADPVRRHEPPPPVEPADRREARTDMVV